MKHILLAISLLSIGISFGQKNQNYWTVTVPKETSSIVENKRGLLKPQFFQLNIDGLKQALNSAPKRGDNNQLSNTVISFPNAEGKVENFSIKESSNMDPVLAAKFPEIKSYVGQGIDNQGSIIYFSVSPLGVQTMTLYTDRSATLIEPYTTDASIYAVYRKQDKAAALGSFECNVLSSVNDGLQPTASMARPNADDAFMRTYRLALSVTAEYTTYFGGTKALALAAMNNSMTRVNGVFEMDFGVHMNLIANEDAIIYLDSATDPYSPSSQKSQWNAQLQATLTSVIGESNYDIGHLFGATGGGGNAGCIGCVCVNGSKGSGITSPADGIPQGDNFDIDYVAHEMGHQFGANHTWTHGGNEGTGVQMEPGSGSTIMGYAGITTMDVQAHSDAYFHAISIQQVTNYIKTTTCQINTPSGNAIPTANAGLDYTIPKSTPFMLTGVATDANSGDVLTYDWEQMDNQTNTTAPNATKTSGVNFRSYNPTTSPIRYFPNMSAVLAGLTTAAGAEIQVEALPNVARTFNFRLTVRDNHIGGPANNSDDAIITVNAIAGPFSVDYPNTAVTFTGGSSQTVLWSVAGTTANGVNCANVDILISLNGGTTWTTLLAATPNDGTQAVTIPNFASTQCRIMVKGTNHVFFDVSNANFTITATGVDTTPPTAPTLVASGTTSTTTNLSWTGATDNFGVTGYDIYKNGVFYLSTVSATSTTVLSLTPLTTYNFTVRAKDAAGNISTDSNTVTITTLSADVTPPTAPTLSASGTTTTTTNLSWTVATDDVGVTGYEVYQNGSLRYGLSGANTTSITATTLAPSTTYTFTVKALDAGGNRSVASNAVVVTTLQSDFTAPTAPTLTASGTTSNSTNLSWSGATDNVAVTGYDVFKDGVLIGSTTTATSYAVTGLTFSTAYAFTVKAKDSAGNISPASNTVNVTTLMFTYCTSLGTIVTDELIGRVQLGTIDNTSTGGTGYTDFTALSTNLNLSSNNTITITPTWTGTVYPEGYAVFIDYNKDGDFVDAGETVWTNAASTTTPVSGTFTVPSTATLGATRMRVSLKYNGIPTSCETFQYGQVEDYTVVIQPANSIVTVKLNIQGYYDTNLHAMRPVKANQGIGSSATDVDSITLELRNTSNVLVASTSSILQTDGTAVCTFNSAPSGSFYLVIKHRNTIETWSATPQTVGSTPLVYDFRTAANKAYGSNMKQVEVGVFALYSGDINQDGFIEGLDFTSLFNDSDNLVEGYQPTDLNGDGFVEGLDFPILFNNSDNLIESMHP